MCDCVRVMSHLWISLVTRIAKETLKRDLQPKWLIARETLKRDLQPKWLIAKETLKRDLQPKWLIAKETLKRALLQSVILVVRLKFSLAMSHLGCRSLFKVSLAMRVTRLIHKCDITRTQSHMWKGYVTHCHTCKWVMSHMWRLIHMCDIWGGYDG